MSRRAAVRRSEGEDLPLPPFLLYLPLFLLPLLLLRRVLFAGEALFWGTPLLQFVPWQQMAAEMWCSGHLPLWNPLLGCGAPLAANYQTGAFYPLYGLALLLPAEVALGWSTVLHLALAGLGMAAWARAAGLDRFPSLLAGLALQGSGFLVARAGLFPSIAVTFPWIPIWLWRAERFARSRSWRDVLWLGATLGLGLLAGHAQTAFYGLLLLLAYLTFRTLRQCWEAEGEPRRFQPATLRVVVAFLIGLGLAAVQLLPTAELFHLSQRAGGVERELGLTYSLWPWRLLNLLLPNLFGSPAGSGYWGYGNYWEDAAYVGLVPLLLALEALFSLRRRGERRGAIAFWALVVLVSLSLALGRNNPLFLWLFDHVPTVDWFQAPARWLALTTVGLAALAGIGAQQWRRGRADRWRGGLGLVFGLAAVLGGLAAPHLVPGLRPSFAMATIRLGLTLAAAGGLVLLRRGQPWWQPAMAGLVLLDLLVFGWGLVPSVDRALYAGRSRVGVSLTTGPAVSRIFWPAGEQPEPGYELKFRRFFRFDRFGPRDLAFWRPLRETLLPNLGMLDGVASANNFEPLLLGHYAAVAGVAHQMPRAAEALGATHLVTATLDAEPHVTPLPGAPGRAWVVYRARALPLERTLVALTDLAFDPAAEVLLPPGTAPAVTAAGPGEAALTLQDGPNRVTIRAVLDRAGVLVLADSWAPGWEATVDGRTAPLLRANYAFRAVYLPAGEHEVRMTYRPWTARVGGAISLLSAAGLALGLLVSGRPARWWRREA